LTRLNPLKTCRPDECRHWIRKLRNRNSE
jgi:hypothetical protein